MDDAIVRFGVLRRVHKQIHCVARQDFSLGQDLDFVPRPLPERAVAPLCNETQELEVMKFS